MQLDYKILWVENDAEYTEAKKIQIESHILEKGFCPNITLREDIIYDEQGSISAENNLDHLNTYQIIFVDYNLDSDNFGDKFIRTIREQNIYTNIVFYSSEIERVETEISKNKEERLQGIYLYDREQFNSDDLYELIDFFLEKDMNDNTMRGIVMSEVARFDAKIWQCLTHQNFYDCTTGVEVPCQVYVATRVKKSRQELHDEVKELNDQDIWNLVDKDGTIVLDSMKRSYVLRKDILGKSHILREKLLGYEQFLPKRNRLAHEINSPFSTSDYLQMRKDILSFRNTFDELCNELSKLQKEEHSLCKKQ